MITNNTIEKYRNALFVAYMILLAPLLLGPQTGTTHRVTFAITGVLTIGAAVYGLFITHYGIKSTGGFSEFVSYVYSNSIMWVVFFIAYILLLVPPISPLPIEHNLWFMGVMFIVFVSRVEEQINEDTFDSNSTKNSTETESQTGDQTTDTDDS